MIFTVLGVYSLPGPNLRFKLPSRGHMESVEHEPVMGVWGQSSQRGPGAELLVRGAKALLS